LIAAHEEGHDDVMRPWCTAPPVAWLLLAVGCGSATDGSDPIEIVPLVDLDPSPGVVEVELVAAPGEVEYLDGKAAEVWGYRDGSVDDEGVRIPGPLLELEEGDHVVVRFRNDLPEETTIHWHGLRVPNAADGTPTTQVAVAPGEEFTYEFDALDPGTFWYHPHVAADTQIERGLYGPIVVRGGVAPDVAAERVLVLDDIKLEATGQLSTETDPLDIMLGRQGNVLLVNGHAHARARAAAGSRERWRIVNAANGRYFNLTVPGHELLTIGWDGGLLPEPYRTERLLVAPGERYEVLVELGGSAGDVVTLQTVHYDRGHDIPDPGPLDLLTFELADEGDSPAPLPTEWGAVDPLAVDDTTPTIELLLSEEEGGDPSFFINGERFPDITPTEAISGDVAIWSIRNDAEMDHPFHLHGMFFQVLDVAGTPVDHLGWKDTVNIPQLATVRFAVRYGEPGRWMYHCHILEHAERGMMGELELSAAR
jgi:FtsP/CotA-like multicopper oxidase with cupredoxin domain